MQKISQKGFFACFLAVFFVLSACLCVFGDETDRGDNIAKGLSYTVFTGEPIEYSYANYSEDADGFDKNSGQLTDSVTALSDGNSNGWYRSFRGKSRIVQFDLGQESSVMSVTAGFFQNSPAGIYAPRYINIFLSQDGESWQCVHNENTGFDLTAVQPVRYDFEKVFKKSYAARYVRVEYCCDIIAYCDEIGIYGFRTLFGDEQPLSPDKDGADGEYTQSVAGAKDIIKIYNGYLESDPEKALNTSEEFLPYLAYLDREGRISDTLFDAVALVPCHTDYPSGGRLVKTNGKQGGIMSDWDLYYDLTFGADRDLYHLDHAAETVFSALGKSQKLGVFLTVPFPTVIGGEFGDIDGDGAAEYCSTLEERLAIVKWYMKKCVDGFENAGFQNLTLSGFYWYREEVNYSETDHEHLLVQGFNTFADFLGVETLFDPFYLSTGFDHWQELGFDGAVMQPNFAFRSSRDYFSVEMLEEFAFTAKKYELGVEIETDEPSYFKGDQYLEAGRNFESYLYYGAKTGYIDAVKTYYQGAGPGTFFDLCHADTSTPKGLYLRRLYELLYGFIKGNYSNTAPVVEVSDFEVVSGDRVTVDIGITDTDSYWGDVSVEFVSMPLHGQVAVAATKKTLIYRADGDFSGEDSFVLVVTDGFSRSEEITVNVTVSAQTVTESSCADDLSEDCQTSEIPQEKEQKSFLWYLIGGAGLSICIALTVALTSKQRRK